MSEDERRAQDHADAAMTKAAEAAELAEHIRDTEPRYTRERQFALLVEMIDAAHKDALKALMELEDD